MRPISKTRIYIALVAILLSLCAQAQVESGRAATERPLFSHLDVGLTGGTGGIGLEIKTPLADWARVRAGIGYMPRFNVPMTFALQSYVPGEGSTAPITSTIERMQEMLSKFTGVKIDDKVDMNAHATMVDFKLLVDFYPLRNNKHFYVTAGFYWGTSKIGHIENTIREMPSLVGVAMYNHMYDFFVGEKYWDEPLYGDYYIDIAVGDQLRDNFKSVGKVGAHMGDFNDTGKPFLLVPGEDGLIKADMFVNSFKPYLGLGYETAISANKRWHLGVDAGVLFWGGAPKVRTHQCINYAELDHNWKGTDHKVDLVNDVSGIAGKAGDYIDITSKLKVYPMLNLSISYTIF